MAAWHEHGGIAVIEVIAITAVVVAIAIILLMYAIHKLMPLSRDGDPDGP